MIKSTSSSNSNINNSNNNNNNNNNNSSDEIYSKLIVNCIIKANLILITLV